MRFTTSKTNLNPILFCTSCTQLNLMTITMKVLFRNTCLCQCLIITEGIKHFPTSSFNRSQNELCCQVCLHIQRICSHDKSSTVQQKDSDRTKNTDNKKNKQIMNNNIQIDNFMYRYITMYKCVCTGILCAI